MKVSILVKRALISPSPFPRFRLQEEPAALIQKVLSKASQAQRHASPQLIFFLLFFCSSSKPMSPSSLLEQTVSSYIINAAP
jgi:hypothetical protein